MGKQGTLTKAEMQVMNILWSLPSMKGTISDVLDYETGIYAESAGRGEGGLVRRFVVLFGSFFCQRGTYLGRRIERNA